LIKSLRWWDGFILALAVPIFLFPDLGNTVVKLGALGAIFIWLASVLIGALQNNIYAELATMMPHKSGGIGIYAHEGFKRYTPLVGPLVTWGYWFGWCVVLSINGLLVGDYLRTELWPHADAALLPKAIGSFMLLGLLVFNLFGMRLGKWLSYVLGTLTMIPVLILTVVPFLNGSFHAINLQPFALPGHVGLFTWAGISLIFYWLYIAGWSSYAFESVATFAPEFADTIKDTPRALRSSAIFSVAVYGLVPLALVGALGQKGIAAQTYTVFDLALKAIVGSGLGTFIVMVVVAALVLSANLAGVNSTRALWQMSKDHMTLDTFSHLNKYGVPDRAMYFTIGVQIVLIWTLGDPLYILAASNLGYILCHVCALIAFILLRRDRPMAVRPIRLGAGWVYVAGLLAGLNLAFIVIGGPQYGIKPMLIGLAILLVALVLYLVRTRVQDRSAPVPVVVAPSLQ
jgi:amino acid transporter